MSAHIAVIDDDRETRELLQSALELEGYRTSLLSGDGGVVAQLEALAPDLIMLDVMIAGLDGYELCALIKQSQKLQKTPVLFVSGMPAHEAEHKLRLVGADSYLSKPFLLKSLYQKIKTLLGAKG
jgi:DNA-binding response OmpR family regulator